MTTFVTYVYLARLGPRADLYSRCVNCGNRSVVDVCSPCPAGRRFHLGGSSLDCIFIVLLLCPSLIVYTPWGLHNVDIVERVQRVLFLVCTMSQDEDVKPKLNLVVNYDGQRGSLRPWLSAAHHTHRHHRQSEAKHALSQDIRSRRGVWHCAWR